MNNEDYMDNACIIFRQVKLGEFFIDTNLDPPVISEWKDHRDSIKKYVIIDNIRNLFYE